MKITKKADIAIVGSPDGRTGWDNTAEKMAVHHSAFLKSKKPRQFYAINDWHKARWPRFISNLGFNTGYNFIIEQGEIWQAREIGEELAAHRGGNKKYLAVCFSGDYRTEVLDQKDKEAFKKLMHWIKEILGDEKTLPLIRHSQISSTDCPAEIDVPALQEFVETETDEEPPLGSNRWAMIKRLLELILQYFSTRSK